MRPEGRQFGSATYLHQAQAITLHGGVTSQPLADILKHLCRLRIGIEGLIWKDLRATFGTRLAETGCDAFTIAQLLGHSDVRVTMRYVRTVEESKRAAVDAVQYNSRKNVHELATWPKQPSTAAAVNG